jgi:hypothetical protein
MQASPCQNASSTEPLSVGIYFPKYDSLHRSTKPLFHLEKPLTKVFIYLMSYLSYRLAAASVRTPDPVPERTKRLDDHMDLPRTRLNTSLVYC